MLLYDGTKWQHREELLSQTFMKVYHEDHIDYMEYMNHPDKIMYPGYTTQHCVAHIRLRCNWNGYAFIEDIAVCAQDRDRSLDIS